MAFEGLTEKLSAAFKKLRGKGRLTEADVKEAMREIRLALLEADVSYKVVKDFIKTVTERAVGADVLESLTPAQMIVKIVNEELTTLMGSENQKLRDLLQAAHGRDAGGPAGRRQDHQRRQAGRTLQEAGQAAAAGGLRHLPSRRHQAAAGGRRKAGYSRFSRWARPIPWKSPRPPSPTPTSTATTWSSWTPPAASISTRR